jgi:predicted RNase H-like nuclease (RuvC/YqgF family)
VPLGFGLSKFAEWAKTVLESAEKVRDLLELQSKTTATVERQNAEIGSLRADVVTLRLEIERLKAREEVIIARSEAAEWPAAWWARTNWRVASAIWKQGSVVPRIRGH